MTNKKIPAWTHMIHEFVENALKMRTGLHSFRTGSDSGLLMAVIKTSGFVTKKMNFLSMKLA
jgi:hypothetical protein